MVTQFWRTCALPWHTTTGVMTVIPQKFDERCLKDWQPLTMLKIIYKIVAKLLANRQPTQQEHC